MTELNYCLVCDSAIISRETGQLSIINVVNGIKVEQLPVTLESLYLVVNWQRDISEDMPEESFRVRVFVEPPSLRGVEPQFAKDVSTVTMPKDQFVVNTITPFGVQFTEAGENRVVIERKMDKDWKPVGTVILNIVPTKL